MCAIGESQNRAGFRRERLASLLPPPRSLRPFNNVRFGLTAGEMMMSLLWYYRPEHTKQGRQKEDMPDELFASKHRDVNSVACIDDRCYVLTFNEYCRSVSAAPLVFQVSRFFCNTPNFPRTANKKPIVRLAFLTTNGQYFCPFFLFTPKNSVIEPYRRRTVDLGCSVIVNTKAVRFSTTFLRGQQSLRIHVSVSGNSN